MDTSDFEQSDGDKPIVPGCEDAEDSLPGDLIGDLKSLATMPVKVPASVDEQILSSATAHFANPGSAGGPVHPGAERWRIGFGIAAGGLAAAAIVGICVLLMFGELGNYSSNSDPIAGGTNANGGRDNVLPGDVDRSGGVDIIDAWTLAKQIEAGDEIPPMREYDLNRDGAVDGSDVQAIAAQVVDLDPAKGPRS